jgi:hypothetical protein
MLSLALLAQARGTTRAGEHAGGRHLVPTGRTIEPVATVLALRIGEPLFLFTFWAHAVHLAIGDVVFEDHPAFCAALGIAPMIGRLAARCRANENRVTGITPVFAAGHLFTNRTLFHQNSSVKSHSVLNRINLSSSGGLNYHQHNHYATTFPAMPCES